MGPARGVDGRVVADTICEMSNVGAGVGDVCMDAHTRYGIDLHRAASEGRHKMGLQGVSWRC